jgi:hypothetical protein
MLILKEQTKLQYLHRTNSIVLTKQTPLLYLQNFNLFILTKHSRLLFLYQHNITIPALTLYFMIITQKQKISWRIL